MNKGLSRSLLVLLAISLAGNVFAKTQGNTYIIDGVKFLNEGKYEKAIPEFNKAIDQNSHNFYAYDWLCILYTKKRDLNQALRNCNIAITISPRFLLAYKHRANIYYLQKQYDKSWDDVKRILKIEPDYKFAHGFLESLKKDSGTETGNECRAGFPNCGKECCDKNCCNDQFGVYCTDLPCKTRVSR